MHALIEPNRLFVWLDGAVVAADDPRLPAWNYGVGFGDGVYETFRTYASGSTDAMLQSATVAAHLDRLVRGCRFMGIDPPSDPTSLIDACRIIAQANGLIDADARLRIVVRRGAPKSVHHSASGLPSIACYALPVDQAALDLRRERGLHLITLAPSRVAGDQLYNHKVLNGIPAILARLRCEADGVDDALFLNSRGEVCEAVWSNIFAVSTDGGTLITPPTDVPCLPGMVRTRILDLAQGMGFRVLEQPLRATELTSFREIFATSSVSEIMPVISIDRKPVGSGVPGPVVGDVQRAYRISVAI